MNPARTILAVVAAAGLIVTAAPLWADSAAPTGNAADFLNGVNCPTDTSTTPCFNPNAAGTKFDGPLTVVYDVNAEGCVTNVFFNLTLQAGNSRASVATDYVSGVRAHSDGFTTQDPSGCPNSGDNQHEQVSTIVDLIRLSALPALYSCGRQGQPACPSFFFQVKAVTNFVPTSGNPSTDNLDGFSANITIAVR
jgi:hypothetical protein